MESTAVVRWRKEREIRLLAYAAAISLIFHLVPLFLFSIQLPERGPEAPERDEIGMIVGGVDLTEIQQGLPVPPQEPILDSESRIDPSDTASRRSWNVETDNAMVQRPDRISTVENPVESGEWTAVLPRREFNVDSATERPLERIASLTGTSLPQGPNLPEVSTSRAGSDLALPPAANIPAETFPEITGLTDGDPGLRQRRILAMPKPVYPAGENTATRVVLRFNVLPDGSVIDIRVERKGGPAFDLEATRTLRKWRFEPLPAQVPQATQWGRVVIRFSVE